MAGADHHTIDITAIPNSMRLMGVLLLQPVFYAAQRVGDDAEADRVDGHTCRTPGARRLMSGTVSAHPASDHKRPFVLNNRNWMYQATTATIAANRTRPTRESGVVLGSEIMKNVNNSSAPLSGR